ncbi:30S ribosome-binding factor RbfA [Alsobacter sp. SYSU M60028]|uniref:Ribosome-binding factor A n=1 Tax=Alsobacter ponti TaxID=2962936 RepID=A0ABT1LJ45_9HYPH|nr:30S ribosome-binding factor RbfA [Alsobacter ponti]MCP8941156.1 30S ribosome-binding factor RbfA [Alsobacter ponti]
MKRHDAPRTGPSQRQLRVGELIRHAMTDILARGDMPEPVFARAFVTVPEVGMSPDLKLATVYLTLHDQTLEKDVLKALESHRKMLRSEIAHRVNLKFAPDIRFRIDRGLDAAARIDALLRSPQVQRDLRGPAADDADTDSD